MLELRRNQVAGPVHALVKGFKSGIELLVLLSSVSDQIAQRNRKASGTYGWRSGPCRSTPPWDLLCPIRLRRES